MNLIFIVIELSRGFGFVTFKDPRVLDEVLQMTPHIIDGKQVIMIKQVCIVLLIILFHPLTLY
jgi:hypothetical protein